MIFNYAKTIIVSLTVRNPVLTGSELCMHVLYSGKRNRGELSFSSLTRTRTKVNPHLAP